jgi:hypothetical protein
MTSAPQDELMRQPRLLQQREKGVHAWARELAGGDIALVVINMNDADTLTASVDAWELRGAADAGTLLDLWSGEKRRWEAQITAVVAPHAAALLRVGFGA